MKTIFSISLLVAAGLWSAVVPINAQVNVTQYHNNSSRDGLYVDSAFTQSAAANLVRDLNFGGTIVGNVLAQPLYVEGGPGGRAMVIVATILNNVYALDAVDGTIIWQRNVGPAVPANQIHCDEVGDAGITGAPVVDVASRALFLSALTTPDGGTTKIAKMYGKSKMPIAQRTICALRRPAVIQNLTLIKCYTNPYRNYYADSNSNTNSNSDANVNANST